MHCRDALWLLHRAGGLSLLEPVTDLAPPRFLACRSFCRPHVAARDAPGHPAAAGHRPVAIRPNGGAVAERRRRPGARAPHLRHQRPRRPPLCIPLLHGGAAGRHRRLLRELRHGGGGCAGRLPHRLPAPLRLRAPAPAGRRHPAGRHTAARLRPHPARLVPPALCKLHGLQAERRRHGGWQGPAVGGACRGRAAPTA